MELELVGSPGCPYVDRVRLVLLEKRVPYRATGADLARPPPIVRDAPLQQVPLLIIRDGRDEEVIFESSAICEFIDQVSPEAGRLMPEDPVERALVRAWSEFASACLRDLDAALDAPQSFASALERLQKKLDRLSDQVEGPFFLGDALSLADVAFAPLLRSVQSLCDSGLLSWPPALRPWWEAMAALPSVQQTFAGWQKELDNRLARGSQAARLLA